MKFNKMKSIELTNNAWYVSKQAFDVSVKCGYCDMEQKSNAYAVYMICTEIYDYDLVPVCESELDYWYLVLQYNSLRLLLDSVCTDKKQYHVEVLDACEDSEKVWKAFNRMKYLLDNFECEIFGQQGGHYESKN